MATSSSCSYEVISPRTREIVIINQRVDNESVDKVMLWLTGRKSRVTVRDYDEHIIKSILFDDGPDYTRYWMYFTGINGSVDTVRIYDTYGKLLDDEVNHTRCMKLAWYILWYETLPAMIGKKKSNGGLSKEEDDEEGEICSICYDEYQEGEMIGTMACKQSYHEGCIKNWLSRKKTCPICRDSTKFPFIYRTCS